MDEASLRTLFHGALDEVAPPKPWLVEVVRGEVRRRRSTVRRRRDSRLWTPALRRAIAAVLVLAVAGAAAAATIAIYEHTRHAVPVINSPGGPVTRSCGSGGVQMFDKEIGWQGSQRTTDGGHTWRDVSPPPPPGSVKGGRAFCPFDSNVAWSITSTGTSSYQSTQLVVMSTRDAGQSWQSISVIGVPWQVSSLVNFSVLMDFVDLQHGWIFMEYATQPLQRRVYATSDGGVTWVQVSTKPDLGLGNLAFDCSQSGLMFDTVQRGWLTWSCSSGFGDTPPSGTGVVAATDDGGRTWFAPPLEGLPATGAATCDASSPIFTRSVGVLQVRCSGGVNVVYSTADGGSIWSAHPLDVWALADFVSGATGFYYWQNTPDQPTTLYRTDDSGANWKVVASGLFPGQVVSSITFLDDQVGFLSAANSPAPWWTYDGGKTWALPVPYRSVGTYVCDVPGGSSSQNQLPQSVKMDSPTVGWAAGGLRTVDGGVHWTSVVPPSPTFRDIGYGDYFLDAQHAWVVEAVGTKTACADHFVVYGTSDGGTSWQQFSSTVVRGLPQPNVLAGTWTVRVEFVDTAHGWILVQPDSGFGGPVPGPLYSTVDGGKTWTVAAAQASWASGDCSGQGLPLFSSPNTGWVPDTCTGATRSSANLLVTHDGGQTWRNVELVKNYCDLTAYPTGCPIGGPLPTFLDANNGWYLDTNTPTLLMTTDGGSTWTRHPLPQGSTYSCQGKFGPTTCSTLSIAAASFVDSNTGWVLVSDYSGGGSTYVVRVERTNDGGRTWTVVSSRTLSALEQTQFVFEFVDANDGFWWINNTAMRTADGGRTWTSSKVNYS